MSEPVSPCDVLKIDDVLMLGEDGELYFIARNVEKCRILRQNLA
jgi:hypothetical protein